METIAHSQSPPELNGLAHAATRHCLTGCAIGEFLGMAIATALGWGDVASIALAVGLAYVFGFSLTIRPLIRARLAAGVIEAETAAIEHYNKILEFCEGKDLVTQDMVIEILHDEERHRRLFEGFLREFEAEGLA